LHLQQKRLNLVAMSDMPTDKTVHTWVELHRAQRRLLDRVAADLKRSGLPPLDWYDVLLELRRAGEPGLRQYEIGEKILLSKHNLSRLIDRLEKQGLAVREACAEDGRGNRIKITARGEQTLQKSWPVYGRAVQREFGEKLGPREQSQLARLLDKLLQD
jgi:DNA-binding MarR family transcriptional regulator